MARVFLRAIKLFPAVFLCLWAGYWLVDIVDPHGMSFGEPLADRLRAPFQLGAYPLDLVSLSAILAASLLLAGLMAPGPLGLPILCAGGFFAGALYYELFLGGLIEVLFSDWPRPVGNAAALSSLVWPHLAIFIAALSGRMISRGAGG